MPTCNGCKAAPAYTYGSGPYLRTDLCVGCFYDYFTDKTRAEDAVRAAVAFQAPPGPPAAPAPADTPVWKRGSNVKLSEKPCDGCGKLIDIRKRRDGKHYPANHGTTEPHWRSCAKRKTNP